MKGSPGWTRRWPETLGGEYRRLDTVVFASCSMLAACHLAGDFDRAKKWCRVADEFMQTFGCPFLYARCRTHYGGVLVAAGQWNEAEEQLQAALQMSEDAGPGPRMAALAQLVELRLRQGRVEEAEALLALMDDTSEVALAAAGVRMARGEPAVAAGILERRAKLLGGSHIEAAATLAMLVDARLGDGDLAAAQGRGRPPARRGRRPRSWDRPRPRPAGQCSHRRGRITPRRSNRGLKRALQQLAGCDRPFDTACVRLFSSLASSLRCTDSSPSPRPPKPSPRSNGSAWRPMPTQPLLCCASSARLLGPDEP